VSSVACALAGLLLFDGFPRWKLVERPLIPVESSAIDAAPFVLLLLLLGVALFGAHTARRYVALRWATRLVAMVAFVLMMHRCLCAIRGWFFGLRFLARDDLDAFNMLCIVLPLVASGLVAGRLFCGWICPLGLLQDLIHLVTGRACRWLPRSGPARQVVRIAYAVSVLAALLGLAAATWPRGLVLSESFAAIWGVVLGAVVVLRVTGLGSDHVLKKLRAWSLASWMLLGAAGVFLTNPWCILTGGELDHASGVGLLAVLLVVPLVPLAWCRYLCPLGALLSLLARRALISLRRPARGEAGMSVCPMGAIQDDRLDGSSCCLCRACGGSAGT
jgi:polyferredoxin